MFYSQIPDLRGRQFHIEYAEPTDPNGYPLPSQNDSSNNEYPVPAIVDELPSTIIQHVRSSENPELKAALSPIIGLEKDVQKIYQPQPHRSKSNGRAPIVFRHRAKSGQKVQQSQSETSDDSNSYKEVCSSK